MSRLDTIRAGLFGLGVRSALPAIFGHASLAVAAQAFAGGEAHPERILVVAELTGGNDGLDTVAPYTNDDYHRARPTLGLKKEQVLKLNDEFGLHPSLGRLRSVWDDGQLAVVQGRGYPNPDRSHFTSMEFWHTATPHVAQNTGWVAALPTPIGRNRSPAPS
jgi:uncharacterized protein (DUF1501 family)